MPRNEKAAELYAKAISDRERDDSASAIKHFTMSLSYESDPATYLERARTYLQHWNKGNRYGLESIVDDIQEVQANDGDGRLRKQLQALIGDVKQSLRTRADSLPHHCSEEEVQRILSEIEQIKLFKDVGLLQPEFVRLDEVAQEAFRAIEAEKQQWTLDTVFEYFSADNMSKRQITDTYQLAACAAPEEEVQAFEQQIGFRLPEDFREFTLSPLGGLYIEVKEELWPRAELGEVGPFWSFLYGIKVFGLALEVPEWLDMRIQYEEMRSLEVGNLVPFMQIEGDSDLYCFDDHGSIVKWHHDDIEDQEVVELTFAQLLLSELKELEQRKERKLDLLATSV